MGRPRKFRAGLVADLIAFAEHRFRLDAIGSDGATKGEHLKAAEKQLARQGKRRQLTRGPECPHQLLYLWNWFCELSAARGFTGFGPARISPLEMIAGVWLFHRTVPAAWEARTLQTLDAMWIAAQASVGKTEQSQDDPDDKPKRKRGKA